MKIKYAGVFAMLLFPLSHAGAERRTAPPSAGVATAGTGPLRVPWRTGKVVAELRYRQEAATQRRSDLPARSDLLRPQAEADRLRRGDGKAGLEAADLLDADVPNEGQVEAQVDQVLSARGKLEREFTMMNLDLRKVLSLDQWRQLKTIRGPERGAGGGDRVFFRKVLPPGGGPSTAPLPPGRDSIASPSPSSRRRDVLKFVSAGVPPAVGRSCPPPARCRRYRIECRPRNAFRQHGRRFLRVKLSLASSPRKPDEIWRHHFPRLQLRP